MGNVTSNDLRNRVSRKVIFWNGTVEEFSQPITVAELMMDHPNQVVVELRPAFINGHARPTPLPADKNLDPDKLYLMVPVNKHGKPLAFSGEEARRLLTVANISLRGQRFLPLLVKVCTGPEMGAASVSDKLTVRKKKSTEDDSVVGFFSGEFDFVSGRRFGKGWKPSLDTIVEKREMETKVNHWLF